MDTVAYGCRQAGLRLETGAADDRERQMGIRTPAFGDKRGRLLFGSGGSASLGVATDSAPPADVWTGSHAAANAERSAAFALEVALAGVLAHGLAFESRGMGDFGIDQGDRSH